MSAPARLDRTLIRVSGPEARSFLQGVLTQDVDKLDRTSVLYAALLSPQGKVIADMFLWAAPDGVVIDADPARGAELMRRLSMYKLRAQATLEDVSGDMCVVVADAPFEGALVDPRLSALGWRKLAPSAVASALSDASPAYDARRLALGVPDLARDAAPEEVFALEGLLEELNGVDFKKGCFVGQENVSRMKRRATTRKKFCPILFEGPAPEFGAPVLADGAEIGTVRIGADGRALALVRLDRALDALEAGQALAADGRAVRLAPPAWLILPQRQSGAPGEPD
jgi:tRNA-modifying protein YgfZ